MKLLPTPTTRDYKDGQATRIRDGVVQDDTLSRAIFEHLGGWSLMPTPKALDGEKGNLKTSQERLDAGRQVDLTNVVIDLMPTVTAQAAKHSIDDRGEGTSDDANLWSVAGRLVEPKLFATPNTMDSLPAREGEAYERVKNAGGRKNRESSGNLREQVVHVLPTTTTNGNERKGPGYASAGILQELEMANGILPKEYADWNHAAEKTAFIPEQKSEKTSLDNDIVWGKFEPAIRRWEAVLGRPAPAPTKPDGKDGAHRLSSSFTEWMMGVPAGWITDCGLTRNEELKACGNGVVPQQAAMALQILLQGLDF